MFGLETFVLGYWEKTQTENQQLFDGIIDVTLFDGVERLDFTPIETTKTCQLNQAFSHPYLKCRALI